ncbi:hypothetical protein EXN66_Car009509 [Channa argus]|uniref:Uncharacterized protein n=1 Tax=Channa argus TaxID=215402 RepID=A0A6G1PUH0_CHAAH|nr:hypothetical protein EXN66_Car009509 [Channa argus]
MELHCLPTKTPTSASSCSTDPSYDNCPPFSQRGRAKGKEMESKVECPGSPLPGLAPAVAGVPKLVTGGRGPGVWPDHSYCSWRGGLGKQDWEVELGPVTYKAGGEGGVEQGGTWGQEDRAHLIQTPSPPQSEEHRSALSVYDNLPNGVTPDSLQEVLDMETSFQQQEQMEQAQAPNQIQGLMEDEGVCQEKSSWSSCKIILSESGSSNQNQNPDKDKKHEKEPELDSGADLMLHLQLPMSSAQQHLTESSTQLSLTGCQALWSPAETQEPKQSSCVPRVPPPVPLADPSASALRSLLTSLQQQIVQQREQYEERIIR